MTQYFSAWEQVYIHVYKLKDSDLGFYHTGIELYGSEFTYCQVRYDFNFTGNVIIWCQDRGIVRHRPRKCDWGQFLGSINLGEVTASSHLDLVVKLRLS